jgi:ABC-type sugar transport system ATPase subunit
MQVRDIEKSFPGVRALSGVSFDVRHGEVHALLGEKGAGKSTLIKIVSGVYQPDLGSILVDGREVRFASPDDARRAGIATIYQELLLFPELSVAENIFLGHAPLARAGRIDWRAMRAEADKLLASLEIDDLTADEIVGALSVGNRQRVEILRALSHDARILIMDEPMAALTESDVTRLFDVVRRLKRRGVGVVYISHRLDEIFAIADRVTVLRDGAFVEARKVADTNAAELVQMMVGGRIDNLFPKTEAAIGAPTGQRAGVLSNTMEASRSLSPNTATGTSGNAALRLQDVPQSGAGERIPPPPRRDLAGAHVAPRRDGRSQLFDLSRRRNQRPLRLSRACGRSSNGRAAGSSRHAALVGLHERPHGRKSRRKPGHGAARRGLSSGLRR